MLPMLHKHTLITAALLASLTLTACGSKKDVIATPPPAKTETDNTNGKIGGGLPDPSVDTEEGNTDVGGGVDVNPPTGNEPGPIPDGQGPLTPIGGDAENKPNKPVRPPKVEDQRPIPDRGSNPIPGDYNPGSSDSVIRDDGAKRLTGAVTADGLLYSSSSTDDLLDFLRARNQQVNHETRRMNEQAAASVVSAKLVVDSNSNDAMITLKVQEGKGVATYNLTGSSDEGPANKLRSVRAANGESTTGGRAIEGTLKCVDFDGGCETTMVRLKIGSTPSSAIIYVVFRSSNADVKIKLPGEYSNNPEYALIREFAMNSYYREQTTNKIKTVTMKSWEVVNGRSAVTMAIKGGNGELLAFNGPLLTPEAGTGVNIPLERVTKDNEDTLDLMSSSKSKLTYASYLGASRMVANNSLGQVRIALKMRQRGSYKPEQFLITFMRKIKSVVHLTDDNLK